MKKSHENPLVSIITICFNAEKHIEKTILSVLGQKYKNFEYIIIDGGSKDKTVSIIKKYEDNLAYWVSEPDKGISDAFNKGIKKASGDIIGIINADDWYEENTLELVVKESDNADVLFGNLRLWKNNAIDFVYYGNLKHLKKEMTINHPTVFVKNKCYKESGLFSTEYKCAMDYELMLRFKNYGYSFVYINAVLSNMRWEGLSDTGWKVGCRETLMIKNKYFPQKKISNKIYYYKHISAIGFSKAARRMKLLPLLNVYRKHLAPVKKK